MDQLFTTHMGLRKDTRSFESSDYDWIVESNSICVHLFSKRRGGNKMRRLLNHLTTTGIYTS